MSWLTVLQLPKHQTVSTLWLVFQNLLQQVYHWPVLRSHNQWNQPPIQSESLSYFTSWLKSASDGSITCGTMVSLTKLSAHFSSATDEFFMPRQWVLSVDLVGWKKHPCNSRRNWRRSKNVKSCQNVCAATPFDWHFQHFQFTEKGECRLFSLYKIPKSLVKSSNSRYIESSDKTLNIYFHDHNFYG